MAEFFKDNENLEEEDNDIIILHNEVNDTDDEFYHLATLDVDKRWFIIMKPVEKLEDIADDEVLIYAIVEKDGEDRFEPIEDEALLNKVFKEFEKELEKAVAEEENN